ncbi:MAG: hypothetical protein IJE14_10820 [Clostridia bacterium]|nr:hypothetical protein [Clostridia bacterium]
MPQRKDYDVYAGNQKVGEIWSEHPTKTDYEVDLNIQKQVADLYFEKAKEDKLTSTEWYKAKEAKMEKHYKIRQVIGVLIAVGSVIMAILTFINRKEMESFVSIFVTPSVGFGLGRGLFYTDIVPNMRSGKPRIDWGVALGMFAGSTVIFFIVYFLLFIIAAFVVSKFFE